MSDNVEHIIGIDLGTTNSVVAVMEGESPVVIPNSEGSARTPSVVAFTGKGEVVVGELALRQAATNPQKTITAVKRLMGRFYSDLEEREDTFSYRIAEQDDNILIDVDGKGYTPQQISSLILKKLKAAAEDFLGAPVAKAVLAVPAYFDDLQREATLEAGKLAGLEVLRLINEPTAAAMAYGLGKDSQQTVAIYDFGGGTFDLSILDVDRNSFEVLATDGDSHLGGEDFDRLLLDKIADEFQQQHGVNLREDPARLYRLKEAVEKAKCELSAMPQTRLSLPFVAYKDGQPLHLDVKVKREEFEELIEPLARRTIQICKKALSDAGLRVTSINRVIMVGGTSRVPLVQEMVADFFDQDLFKGVNPDEVVALGAATQAGVFEGRLEEVVLMDVTPHSLGIEAPATKFSRIIDKNSTIPIKAAKVFTTAEDKQEFVTVHVLQGESENAAENRSLGKFMLTDLAPRPKGVPRIQVTFFINSDGIVEISAKDMESGAQKSLTILHSFLSDSERRERRKQRRKPSRRGKRKPPKDHITAEFDGVDVRGAADSIGLEPGGPGTAPSPAPAFEVVPGEAKPDQTDSARKAASVSPPAPSPQGSQPVLLARTSQPVLLARTSQPVLLARSGQPVLLARSGQPVSLKPAQPAVARAAAASTFAAGTDRKSEAAATETPASSPPAEPGELSGDAQGLSEQMRMTEAFLSLDKNDAAARNVYESAIPEYARFLDKHGAVDWAIMSLAKLHTLIEKPDEAAAVLQRARNEGYLTVDQLIDTFSYLLERFPDYCPALAGRGSLYEKKGMLERAIADLERATARDETNVDQAAALERLYQKVCSKNPDPATEFKLVKVYLRRDKVDEAIGLLQKLAGNPAFKQRAFKILGLCFWQKNLHYLAWQKLKQLELNDEIKDILCRLAADMETAGQLTNARYVLEHLVNTDPGCREAASRLERLSERIKAQKSDSERSQSADVNRVLKDSRFVILEEINRGSMGIVYRAKDTVLDEIVALKLLNDFLCADPTAVERFKTEARAAKKLTHPNIVRIHDFFESGNKKFLSMEYIEGEDLKHILAKEGALDARRIVAICKPIAEALDYAHQRRIVHRDIKPANIMIARQGEARVTDFGIAKVMRNDATLTSSQILGTPLYMAPEQIEGSPVGPHTDIYSLGIVMYEMAAGYPPFREGNIEYHHVNTPPPPMPDAVHRALAAVIMKAIEKKPQRRFRSAGELARALGEIESGLSDVTAA